MTHQRNTRVSVLFGAVLAIVFSTPLLAGSLQVDGNAVSARQGRFTFTVHNDGAGSLDSVRVFSDSAHPVSCSALTTAGRGFGSVGTLAGGDSVECTGRSLATAGMRDASVVVQALGNDDRPHQRTARFTLVSAATSQGIVAMLGGGVHEDTNGDGVLDAGETIDYDYTVLNLGTLALSGLAVSDIDGSVACPQATLAVDEAMTCNGQHVVTAAEAGDGFVMNEVQVAGADADGGSVAANDMVLRMNYGGSADIRALKSPLLADDVDGSGYASAGDLVTYAFVLKNSGGTALDAVNLVEVDAGKLDTPLTCAANTLGGQMFGGLGSGTLAAGDAVLCHADHAITTAEAASGEATNVAEISGQPPFGVAVSGAAASSVLIPVPAAVAVVKSLQSESGSKSGVAEPGETLGYRIHLQNSGGADALGVDIVDPLDPEVDFVSASLGGSESGGNVSWTGLTVPAGGSLDLDVSVRVHDPVTAGVASIANLAYEAGSVPPDCAATPLPDACVVTPTEGVVTISKALSGESGSQPGLAEPGETLDYTITLDNQGGSDVSGFGVTDPLDANVDFVSADNGGTNTGGVVTWTGLTVPAGGTLVLHVSVRVHDPLNIDVAVIANVAHATGTPPEDCSLVPTPAACTLIPTAAAPRLQVTKTADRDTVPPSHNVIFTITVSNVGDIAVADVVVSDPVPTGISAAAWTCSATGGVACPHAFGSGAINETVASFPVGGQLVYRVVATVDSSFHSELVNTVDVSPSSATACMPDGTQSPCRASVNVDVRIPAGVPVPGIDARAMLLLALGLLLLAGRRRA